MTIGPLDDVPPSLTPEALQDMLHWEAQIRLKHGEDRKKAQKAFERRYKRPPTLFVATGNDGQWH